MADTCEPNHDFWANAISTFLIAGLFASYIPQHFRIINKKSSEGFSPWFLLLGATSSAAGMLNMWTMQWGQVKCCRYLSTGSCIESLGGVIQVSLQWALFVLILVFYIIYYPERLKYAEIDIDDEQRHIHEHHIKTKIKSDHWRLSITLSWVVAIHMLLITFITLLLLIFTKPTPDGSYQNEQILLWATFLGILSASLAAIQYYPQLMYTYNLKLVGALSIPMMIIQSPGGFIMAASIALRPGTNWTSWVMYAVSGALQAVLLLMCLAWKARQTRLGIDDFGNPLNPISSTSVDSPPSTPSNEANAPSSSSSTAVGSNESALVEPESRETEPLLKPSGGSKKKRRTWKETLWWRKRD